MWRHNVFPSGGPLAPPAPRWSRRTYHVPVLLPRSRRCWSTPGPCSIARWVAVTYGRIFERGMGDRRHRDPRALAAARERLADYERSGQFRALLGNYAELGVAGLADAEKFDGILLDLGVSSHQFDDPSRGFTFAKARPRHAHGHRCDIDAAELLNTIDEVDLSALLRAYADEPRAARLAREITRRRERRPFATADDLVDAIGPCSVRAVVP